MKFLNKRKFTIPKCVKPRLNTVKKTSKKTKQFLILLVSLMLLILFFKPLFYSSAGSASECYNSAKMSSQYRVMVIKYTYTTGAGWFVLEDSSDDLKNMNVVLKSGFDPRLLRANSDFELDYFAEYIIICKGISEINIDNETVPCIEAKKVYISYNGRTSPYRIYNMTFAGLLKRLFAIVNSKLLISV